MSVLIAILNMGNIKAELAGWLLNTIMKHPDCGVFLRPLFKTHDSNRNTIVKDFLSRGYDYLLFIDHDIVPPPDAYERLMSHDKTVVSALCLSQTDGRTYPLVMKRVSDGWKVDYEAVNTGDLQKVDACGTGCVLIHRSVFESMVPPWFKFDYNEYGEITTGEDFGFFDRIDEVYCDTGVICQHWHYITINETLRVQTTC